MELAVGKDLYSVCGKCGDTWHVIVSMDDGKVTRVQCKQCSGYHRYRTPAGEENVNKKKTARRKVASKGAAKKKVTKVKADEPLIEPDLSRPVRNYSMRETYEPGERIEHPKFGQGVVEATPEAGKVNVFFEDGRRTLAHGRAPAVASA